MAERVRLADIRESDAWGFCWRSELAEHRRALLAALDAVLALHKPGHTYALLDECGHVHADDDPRIGRDEYDEPFCLDSPIGGPVCSECIGSDEEHMTYPCPTVRAIESAIDLGAQR